MSGANACEPVRALLHADSFQSHHCRSMTDRFKIHRYRSTTRTVNDQSFGIPTSLDAASSENHFMFRRHIELYVSHAEPELPVAVVHHASFTMPSTSGPTRSDHRIRHGPSHAYSDALGLLLRIPSISDMTSSVSLGSSCKAFKLSCTCSGLDAPRMTVLTFLLHLLFSIGFTG